MQWSAVLLESDASLVRSSRQQAADSACSAAVATLESLYVAGVS